MPTDPRPADRPAPDGVTSGGPAPGGSTPGGSTGDRPHRSPMIAVWDPVVRFGHWLVVVAFAVAWWTAGDPLQVHMLAGYTVAAVVVARIVWGFVGPRHARFGDFVYGPRTVFGHLASLITGRARRYLGHTPAGGAMAVVLLLCLAATTTTGMMNLADAENAGPLAPWLGDPTRERVPAPAAAEHEGAYQELHGTLANVTMGLVLLHVAGAVFAGRRHGENLIIGMIHGYKRAEPEDGTTPSGGNGDRAEGRRHGA